MRSRSTLRARSLYNDRINRNLSDGLLNVLFLGRDRGVCTKSRRALTLDTPRSPPCSVVIQLSGMTSCST